jgi:hypothetical protein
VDGLLFSRFGEKSRTPKAAGGAVRMDDDAVYIGSLRVDRRHGYFIQVPQGHDAR